MDLVDILRNYVERMLRDVRGMKVLLLDAETTKIVSAVYSQSEILEHEVYLVQRLDAEDSEQLLHMKVRIKFDLCEPYCRSVSKERAPERAPVFVQQPVPQCASETAIERVAMQQAGKCVCCINLLSLCAIIYP